MSKPKGGRGLVAPYDTKLMRVPVGLESQVQELIERYRSWINESGHHTIGANNPPSLLDKAVNNFNDQVSKSVDLIRSAVATPKDGGIWDASKAGKSRKQILDALALLEKSC